MSDQPMRVLVIDDSVEDACAIERVLRGAGALVIERVDTESALRDALLRVQWDVVLSEFGVCGIEAARGLRLVREALPGVPFIVVSGTIGEEAAAAVMRAGADDFVGKHNLARLIPAIGRELRAARSRSERRAAEARLYRLAHFDPLTELPNRNLMYFRVGQQMRRPDPRIAVLVIEMGQLDDVRRTLGPLRADNLFAEGVGRLRSKVESDWVLGRIDRDSLALMVPRIGLTRAEAIASTIHEALTIPLVDGLFRVRVPVCIGIAFGPHDGNEPDGLLRLASIAADHARRTGSGTQVYGADTDAYSRARIGVTADLWGAGERGEFELDFQPKVDLTDGSVVSAEALLRWRRADGILLQPAEFLNVAGECGGMRAVTEWVVRESLRTCQMWREAGCTMRVAVNLPSEAGADPTFPNWLAAQLREYGLPGQALEVDVTEQTIMRDPGGAQRTLRALEQMGVYTVLDDYGAGSSSFSALRELPLRALKIDRSFLTRRGISERNRGLVQAAICVARSLSLDVSAEGIEDADTLVWLRESGCPLGQGYFIARPMPVAPLLHWTAGSRHAFAEQFTA